MTPMKTIFTATLFALVTMAEANEARPNILWIVVEDASPHIGCYDEKIIRTPNLDRLAREGVRFEKAFVTCPVCSPSRSAMVTGMYQTTLGAHNHRSQSDNGKGKGTAAFFDSYKLPVKSIPRLFKDAGYWTCNSATGRPNSKFGKTDYNFIWNRADYDDADWKGRAKSQPFFAQVQLRGGKNRMTKHGTDPAKVTLPPYYPDHPVLRKDWAAYLNSWVQTDLEVDAILKRLEAEGLADSTVVFFWTDHGVSHARGKQFLYEEGIRVPLIVRFPKKKNAGAVRGDLVTHIDVAASSLALAGIDIPKYVQGVDLFAKDYKPRDMIFSARDRCDETVEIQRCVRTKRFKYIRNFLPHLPHLQHNRYKDSKEIVQTLRELHANGKLNELQSRVLTTPRPAEELYDLKIDPHETRNLAADPVHAAKLRKLRGALYEWMVFSRDIGLIPEPILEEMGHRHGNKFHVLKHQDNQMLLRDILSVIDATELHTLTKALKSNSPAVRYWAATLLGVRGDRTHTKALARLTKDASSDVRVAGALALCRLGDASQAKLLADEITNENLLTGMYAIRALELTGRLAKPHAEAIKAARQGPYEFTRRIATRLTGTLSD